MNPVEFPEGNPIQQGEHPSEADQDFKCRKCFSAGIGPPQADVPVKLKKFSLCSLPVLPAPWNVYPVKCSTLFLWGLPRGMRSLFLWGREEPTVLGRAPR